MNVTPLGDRVIVKVTDATDEKVGSLYIPDSAKEKPSEGTVVAVGPGRRAEGGDRLDMEVRKGDTVIYGKWSGTEVEVDGDRFIVLREADILAVK